MDGSGGRGRDDREHPVRWTAPMIDAPIASGAADTEPGTAAAGWGSDDWAWTEFDEATPGFDDEFAGSEEPPTAPDVPVVPSAATALAHRDEGPACVRSSTSRDGRRRRAIGIGALAGVAILVGVLVATTGGDSSRQPKRADTQHSATTGPPRSTTTSTTLGVTTLPTPTTILSSATVVTRPPVAPSAPPTSPPTCNIVTQLLGCH